MGWWRKLGRAVLFPHGAVLILLVPLSAVLLICSLSFPEVADSVRYGSYALSAYTLTALCCKLPSLIRFGRRFRRENRYMVKFQSDAGLRMNLSLYSSLVLNTVYAIFQLGLGLYHSSVWYYAMASYYFMLAVMRFFLVMYTRNHVPGENRQEELHRYRFCGSILLVMNLALLVIVFYITWQNRTFIHHQITTIAMAAYTFAAFIMAAVNVIRYGKCQSPVFSAAKVIGFVTALVSVLTLETTMLTTFGKPGEGDFKQMMTGVTGGAVVLMILCMAVSMIVKSTRELKSSS